MATAASTVGARFLFNPLVSDLAPFTFVILAMVAACVLAGWRSGLVSLAAGQAMTWYLILEPRFSWQVDDSQKVLAFAIVTIAQLLILAAIALYQREVSRGLLEREQRLQLLHHAINEIDHRTRNNYATVLAMVQLQARRAANDEVKAALQQVADRIQAIATASERLALRSGDIDRVRLDDHLCDLVQHIERGLSREEIEVDCDVDDVTASADKATSISIIVNELVTNALKHAFNGQGSGSVRVTGRAGPTFELCVSDDGRGIAATRTAATNGNGLGSRLVESFVRQIGGRHEVVSSEKGTTHRLLIPTLD
ncbi:MAG TPA: histidine kinase dimerization/phosphoacceptor domain -containing protein [Sphingomicrobium sp.]|nr:histidine kinase dimerization/phosphoacceptor domain -containing protein [Sphingomicrobium sp.]